MSICVKYLLFVLILVFLNTGNVIKEQKVKLPRSPGIRQSPIGILSIWMFVEERCSKKDQHVVRTVIDCYVCISVLLLGIDNLFEAAVCANMWF